MPSSSDQEPSGDEAALQTYAQALIRAVEEAMPGWVRRCVVTRANQAGVNLNAEALRAIEDAAVRATQSVTAQLEEMLGIDIDYQRGSPLKVLRDAVRYPTAVLRWLGAPPVVRDDFAEREFPEDDYALTPASFADVDEALHEPGLRWGAAKAHVHLARRRAEGLR
jgi:hypothetical protein